MRRIFFNQRAALPVICAFSVGVAEVASVPSLAQSDTAADETANVIMMTIIAMN
jgi:hypothetical protein